MKHQNEIKANKCCVVLFSPFSWHIPSKQRFHHLLGRMPEDTNFLIVDSASYFMEKLIAIIKNPIRIFSPEMKRISGNVFLLKLYNIFPHKICAVFPFLFYLNNYLILKATRKALNKFKDNKLIIGTENIYDVFNIVDKFGAEVVFYDCYDELTDIPGVDNKFADKFEKIIADKADLIIVSAEKLKKTKKHLNKKMYLISNGVNFNLFEKNAKKEFTNDLFIKNRKYVGYLGLIDDRVDFELVELLLKERKEYEFIFVGGATNRAANTIDKLSKVYHNLKWIGEVDHDDVPYYIDKFDACIIPFKISKYVEGINPVKLYEYFALGKPVVATKWEELTAVNPNCLSLASNKEEFVKAIDYELANNSEEKMLERKKIAKNNSWASKYLEIERIIKEYLGKKVKKTEKLKVL